MNFAIILALAVAANIVGIMFFEWLSDLPWRYHGQNIKARVRKKLDAKWLRCVIGSADFCRDCDRRDACIGDCVDEVKSEIDTEIKEAK